AVGDRGPRRAAGRGRRQPPVHAGSAARGGEQRMTASAAPANGGAADLGGLRAEVAQRLHLGLSPDLHYHDAAHTLDEVVPTALLLAAACELPAEGLRRLHAAALLHDLGFTLTRHE